MASALDLLSANYTNFASALTAENDYRASHGKLKQIKNKI